MKIADRNPWYGKDAGLAALLDQNTLMTELQHAVAGVLTRAEEMALKAYFAVDGSMEHATEAERLLTVQQQHIQAARERFIEAFAHLRITTSGKTL